MIGQSWLQFETFIAMLQCVVVLVNFFRDLLFVICWQPQAVNQLVRVRYNWKSQNNQQSKQKK